jgi:hypothetical protein
LLMLSYVNKNEQDYCNGIMVESDRLFVVVALAMISPLRALLRGDLILKRVRRAIGFLWGLGVRSATLCLRHRAYVRLKHETNMINY